MSSLMVGLKAPDEYGDQPCSVLRATKGQLEECTGGCGPGGVGDMLVPDTIWFLSIRDACKIHDWMYTWGVTREDKEEADEFFRVNMKYIIENIGKKWTWLKYLRRRRANTYYLICSEGGDKSFFDK